MVGLILLMFGSTPALAQSNCLAQAQGLSLVPDDTHRAFLVEGESATFGGGAGRGCVGAVAVAPVHARLRLTLLAHDGEALASSDEQANSAYVLRCGYEGESYVFVEMTRGAGEVHVALGAVAGNQRRSWESRSGTCFSPPVGVSAASLEVGPQPVVQPADFAAAIMDPLTRQGWEPVGTFQGTNVRIEAEGCVRLIALPGTLVEVPLIQRRGSSLSFCLDGADSFDLQMDPPDGGVVVLRRDQIESPPHISSVLWSEAHAQGDLSRLARVHGSSGEAWEDTLSLSDGCHRVVAFGRGAVLSVHGEEEPIRRRRVQGWSQVLFCGAGEWQIKLRFFARGSDVRLFVGDL
ncbi:MAG: hypothetical protein ACI9KE_005657 [Polyangiales bacterium]|jgi:hypothetical protein